MTTARRLIVLFGVSALAAAYDCGAQVFHWQPLGPGEVEFGVTAVIGGIPVQSPSVLEAGYNGGWWFGNPWSGNPYNGMAQTFIVQSPRTLQSIELRVGRFNEQPSGQFEVAIYRFDTLSGNPAEKLAAVLANAEDYPFAILSVPVSSFDFSSFNVSLNSAETYALAVTPTSTFAGGLLTLQSAGDIYPGGQAYSLSDTQPPQVSCLALKPSTLFSNPSRIVGQFQLQATDCCDNDPFIFVGGTKTAFVAGPFHDGDIVEVAHGPSLAPGSHPGAPPNVAAIQLIGDMQIWAVDSSGNASAKQNCR